MGDLNLQIELATGKTTFSPGETIRGTVTITSPAGQVEIKSAELLVFWRTSGIGTKDEGVPQAVTIAAEGTTLPTHFSKDFEITLPLHPCTYHGKLIKINWFIGLYVTKSWRSSEEIELPIDVRMPGTTASPADTMKPTAPEEYFFDEHGKPVQRPLGL